MLKIKRLRELIAALPDNAKVMAYEGEGIGLRIKLGKKRGWIETGSSEEDKADEKLHDLKAFVP